jgi:hypothetical protein
MRIILTRVTIGSLLIVSSFSSKVASGSSVPRFSPTILLSKMAPKDESAVLRELKETIQKQATELQTLRKKLNGGQSSAPAGAHGGGPEASMEDLASYRTRPFYSIAMQRVGWLSVFLSSLSLTAVIMNGFEHTLSRQIELAYFVPLLAGHGGNTGGQSTYL